MKTQNKAQLIGYLGADPKVFTFANGNKKVRMQLATDSYRQKEFDGEEVKKTTWHTIICWAEMAEIAENHFIKGSHIMVEGMIQYCSYIGKDGQRRYVTEIKAFHVADLDR